MPARKATYVRRTLIAVLGSSLLVACATKTAATREDLVRQRALEYWTAYQAGHFEKAYAYLSPASRAVVPYERYRARIAGSVDWKGAVVQSVTCDVSQKCIVKVKLSYEAAIGRRRLGTIERYMDETWTLDDGQWWLVYVL